MCNFAVPPALERIDPHRLLARQGASGGRSHPAHRARVELDFVAAHSAAHGNARPRPQQIGYVWRGMCRCTGRWVLLPLAFRYDSPGRVRHAIDRR